MSPPGLPELAEPLEVISPNFATVYSGNRGPEEESNMPFVMPFVIKRGSGRSRVVLGLAVVQPNELATVALGLSEQGTIPQGLWVAPPPPGNGKS